MTKPLPEMLRRLALLGLLLLPAGRTCADIARVDSLNGLGHDYIYANAELAVGTYRDAVREARTLGYREGEGRALQNLGLALYLTGHQEESVDVALQAIRIYEDLGLREEQGYLYGELGYQLKRRDMGRAMAFMRRGIGIAEAGPDTQALCSLYDNFGVLHEMSGHADSAAFYYRRALDFKTARRDTYGLPFTLNNLAGLAAQQGELNEARELLARSDAYRRAAADSFGLLQNRIQWAELAAMEGDAAAAALRFEGVLADPETYQHDLMASHCFERLAKLYEEQGDYRRAYRNLKRYEAYQDSLYTVETEARIAALELEFETEKKDHQLAESRLAIAARDRRISILAAVLVVLAALAAGVAWYLHLKRRQAREQALWNARLREAAHRQEMADEKLRISRELHDNIGARLTFLVSTLDNLSRRPDEGSLRGDLGEVGAFGRTTLDELRQTVWAMKHEGEGMAALEGKLQELKRNCAAAGRRLDLTVDHDAEEDVTLTSGRLLNIYRIAQEAVQNAVKHTEDAPVALNLTTEAGALLLEVRDGGPGFDPEAAGHVGGLENMRRRCDEVGGEFSLASGPGGTGITCRFPAE